MQEWLAQAQGYEDQLRQLKEELAAQRARQAQQGPAQRIGSGSHSSYEQAVEARFAVTGAGQAETQRQQQEGFSERHQELQPAAIPGAADASAPEQPLALGPGQQQQQHGRDQRTRMKRQMPEHASSAAVLVRVLRLGCTSSLCRLLNGLGVPCSNAPCLAYMPLLSFIAKMNGIAFVMSMLGH